MKARSIKLSIVTALLALASAPVFAAGVTVMPGGAITASGPTSLHSPSVGTIACTTTLTGTVTTNGGITITGATFTQGDPSCSSLVAQNLPWSGQFDSASQITVSGIAIGPGPICGPASLTGSYMNSPSTVTFNNSSLGTCTVNGTLTITPDQTVTNN